MKIFLTGGAGFIGSHLSERLLASGHELLTLDNFDPYYDVTLKEERILRLQEYSAFSLVRGDIRDGALVMRLIQEFRPERIVHLAARAGVRPSIEAPAEYCAVNVTGTANIFEAARLQGTPVVFASSSSVYGDSATPPYCENEVADFPVSPYAATKRAGELLAFTYHHLYQLPITCLRFFTVYGPRQRPDMAIHKFCKAILNEQAITLFGDGTTARDYTYIDDIISGLVASIERAPQLGYEVLNLGGSQTISLRDLVGKIEVLAGKSALIEWQGDQPGDVRLTSANIERARKQLDYAPKTTIDEGLRATIDWLRS